MSVQPETRREFAIFDALKGADAEQLRRELRRRAVAAALAPDGQGEFIEPSTDQLVDDPEAYANAINYWNRGNRREALHHLELALGRDFIGLGDLRPEDLK